VENTLIEIVVVDERPTVPLRLGSVPVDVSRAGMTAGPPPRPGALVVSTNWTVALRASAPTVAASWAKKGETP
jgi:hypothetical protein